MNIKKQESSTPSSNAKPSFLITVDTEGDNLWGKPKVITTENAKHLPRFQSLCESYGFKPSYLTNYEMAESQCFVELGVDAIRRSAGEVGMHLHAWNSPPLIPLTRDDLSFHPYLIEYPDSVMSEKIKVMTCLLEEKFGVKMTSHRAGRWAFNGSYAKALLENGYCVDCSVTPHINWGRTMGDPARSGGANYMNTPEDAYFVDIEQITERGSSTLLEIPMTIFSAEGRGGQVAHSLLAHVTPVSKWLGRNRRTLYWLRPDGKNLQRLLWIVDNAVHQERDYIQFMLHSSEFMPGGSPTFKDAQAINSLYDDLERLFDHIKRSGFVGRTLTEYYDVKTEKHHSFNVN